MNPRESAYWDSVAEQVNVKGGIRDNWEKRRVLIQFLSKIGWSGKKVLEVGVGSGVTAATLRMMVGAMWEYTATDVSEKFCEFCRYQWGFDCVQTDVLALPKGKYDRILALDSLEHVHPNDRPVGYQTIADRLADEGLLLINMPVNRTLHDEEFDHGIGVKDIVALEACGLRLLRYEQYQILYLNYMRDYAFVVMQKGAA